MPLFIFCSFYLLPFSLFVTSLSTNLRFSFDGYVYYPAPQMFSNSQKIVMPVIICVYRWAHPAVYNSPLFMNAIEAQSVFDTYEHLNLLCVVLLLFISHDPALLSPSFTSICTCFMVFQSPVCCQGDMRGGGKVGERSCLLVARGHSDRTDLFVDSYVDIFGRSCSLNRKDRNVSVFPF